MRRILDCGCNIDDAVKSTVHVDDTTRSKGDIAKKVHHYLLDFPPQMYCVRCDRFRPCSCDISAVA